MGEIGPPTQTDKGWGIDWGSPETWRRLAFGTVKLFIIATMTPFLVGVVLEYSMPNATVGIDIIAIWVLSLLIIVLLISRSNTDRGAGQTGFVSAGEYSPYSFGSMRDQIWSFGWSMVLFGLVFLAYRWAFDFFYPDQTSFAGVSSALVVVVLRPCPQLFALLFGRTPVDPAKVT